MEAFGRFKDSPQTTHPTDISLSFDTGSGGHLLSDPAGTDIGSRTLISQLSVATGYRPAVLPLNYVRIWQRWLESNQRVHESKACALTTWLHRYIYISQYLCTLDIER